MSLIVDIKKRLGSFSLSAQLEAGEGVTGILGSSGCGKSMTLKCIAGIERPDSGHIELDGVVLYDSRKRIDLHPQQRRVGYLFQNYALFPNMTLRQNILCGLRNQPDKAQRVKEADEMIAMMGLQGLEKHRPYQLSGGQQQRAALGTGEQAKASDAGRAVFRAGYIPSGEASGGDAGAAQKLRRPRPARYTQQGRGIQTLPEYRCDG